MQLINYKKNIGYVGKAHFHGYLYEGSTLLIWYIVSFFFFFQECFLRVVESFNINSFFQIHSCQGKFMNYMIFFIEESGKIILFSFRAFHFNLYVNVHSQGKNHFQMASNILNYFDS